jgi:hypothetical protein
MSRLCSDLVKCQGRIVETRRRYLCDGCGAVERVQVATVAAVADDADNAEYGELVA